MVVQSRDGDAWDRDSSSGTGGPTALGIFLKALGGENPWKSHVGGGRPGMKGGEVTHGGESGTLSPRLGRVEMVPVRL